MIINGGISFENISKLIPPFVMKRFYFMFLLFNAC